MKYNNETRRAQSENNKTKIINSAKHLIEERGFENVSVKDITDDAGVAKGSFYIHFKSKEDVVQEIVSECFKEFNDTSTEKSAFEKISNFILDSTKLIIELGNKMAQKWFSEAVMSSNEGKQKLIYDLETIKKILLTEYSEEDAEELSKKIIAMFYGALTMWCIKDGLFDSYKTIESYLNKELKNILEKGDY